MICVIIANEGVGGLKRGGLCWMGFLLGVSGSPS